MAAHPQNIFFDTKTTETSFQQEQTFTNNEQIQKQIGAAKVTCLNRTRLVHRRHG